MDFGPRFSRLADALTGALNIGLLLAALDEHLHHCQLEGTHRNRSCGCLVRAKRVQTR
jgi:hypothetical protein